MQDKFRKFLFPTEDETFLRDTVVNDQPSKPTPSSYNPPKFHITEDYDGPQQTPNRFNPSSPVNGGISYSEGNGISYSDFNETPKTSAPQNNLVFAPMNLKDSEEIAKEMVNGSSVIVNLETLLKTENGSKMATRIIDFLCGVAFGLNFNVNRINDSTFMFNR